MPVSFADFLEAKFDLDERSLARDVQDAFWQALRDLPQVECLDVGAGTGATLRRLLNGRLVNGQPANGRPVNGRLSAQLSLTSLDRDRALLDTAQESAVRQLRALGMEPHREGGSIFADSGRLAMHFVAADLNDYRPSRRFDVITAHAFLDIVPLPETLQLFTDWLHPGGHLYASLAYDGDTALLPPCDDTAFEEALLTHYNDTMERRRVNGLPTGGARCGRRLYRLLPEHGFEILACGSSDWNITPLRGQYRDRDALCLQALLEMIGAEARRSDLFDAGRLARWFEDRTRLLRQQRLGLVVHQLDLLARFAR